MQIISDFHDYYDIGMQNGIDPQLLYRRFCREETRSLIIDPHWDGYCPWYHDLHGEFELYEQDKYKFLLIGFAGKIYPAVKYISESNENVYDFDIDKIKPKFLGKPSPEEKKKWLSWIKETINEAFEIKDRRELLDLFERFQTAIFVTWLDSPKIIINERLNQYHFQKVLPPMEAFQELAMYVGARLTKSVIEEPPLPDKIKAEIHGFDKFSFRKGKAKK